MIAIQNRDDERAERLRAILGPDLLRAIDEELKLICDGESPADLPGLRAAAEVAKAAAITAEDLLVAMRVIAWASCEAFSLEDRRLQRFWHRVVERLMAGYFGPRVGEIASPAATES